MILNGETKALVECYFREIDAAEIREKNYSKQGGWAFDWIDDLIGGYRVFCLETKEYPSVVQGLVSLKALHDSAFNGVHVEHIESAEENLRFNLKTKETNFIRRYEYVGIHLVAFACQFSIDEGLEGFVELTSKTATIPFYEKIGAKKLSKSSQKLIFFEPYGQALAKKYFPGGVQWLD